MRSICEDLEDLDMLKEPGTMARLEYCGRNIHTWDKSAGMEGIRSKFLLDLDHDDPVIGRNGTDLMYRKCHIELGPWNLSPCCASADLTCPDLWSIGRWKRWACVCEFQDHLIKSMMSDIPSSSSLRRNQRMHAGSPANRRLRPAS
jgi:hypothetical protein